MIGFKITNETAKEFADKFGKSQKTRIKQGLALIRQEWQQEFRRQDARMQKEWTPLKTWVDGKTSTGKNPDPKSYAERKKKAYYKGKGGDSPVKFLRILKRSGVMLDRYIDGISINNTSMKVSIPFPAGRVGMRAMVHQGYDGEGNPTDLPRGVLAHRPYDTERFIVVANRVIKRELNKG